MKDNIIAGLGLLMIVIVVTLGVLLFAWILLVPFNLVTCLRFEDMAGLPTKFDFVTTTCYAKYSDVWIPIDQIYQLIGK